MSFAIAHFAIGAAFMTVVLGVFAPRFRLRGTLIMASGIWALIPDLKEIAPTYVEHFDVVFDTFPANLFWFHGTLDVLDPDDSAAVAAVALGLWFGVTLFVEFGGVVWNSLAKRTRGRTEHGFGPSD
jgi:hypothetical protein